MNDSRRPEDTRSAQQGPDQTEKLSYPPYADPAYSGQPFYPPTYYTGSNPNEANPTQQLPQYWLHGQPPDQPSEEPPDGKPRPPRWLWIAAALAVLLVTALVIALVIANGTARKQTAVPPLPAMPSSSYPAPTTSRSPSTSTSPSATSSEPTTTESSQPPNAGAMQTVVYNVSGQGRAISITYVDNDGMMQTEFNVALPWSKQVSVPQSGNQKPSVTIVNIGHDVTCTVTVDGVQVNQRTGAGLTVCRGTG